MGSEMCIRDRVNSVPGVPLHGCSAKSYCINGGDQLEIGRSKVRKKPAIGSSSSSRGSCSGRKMAKNKDSTGGTKKKLAASDACRKAKRHAITDVPAKAGAMAVVQAAESSTGDGSGNASGGVHSTVAPVDTKTMLLPASISQQPAPPTGIPSGTQLSSIGTLQSRLVANSWNIYGKGRISR